MSQHHLGHRSNHQAARSSPKLVAIFRLRGPELVKVKVEFAHGPFERPAIAVLVDKILREKITFFSHPDPKLKACIDEAWIDKVTVGQSRQKG